MANGVLTRMLIWLVALLVLHCGMAYADPLPPRTPQTADLVVVLKSDRLMYVYRDGLPIRTYHIQLGGQPLGGKHREGDQRTPQGAYVLDWRNPHSLYYKSIHISYPNARDRRWAARHGINPGGEIMIHGQPDGASRPRTGDWTEGCIAVSDKAMDELWTLIGADTPIHILP